MAFTACLVCLISTVNGHGKEKKRKEKKRKEKKRKEKKRKEKKRKEKKRKAQPWKAGASSWHTTNLKQSILGLLISMVTSKVSISIVVIFKV